MSDNVLIHSFIKNDKLNIEKVILEYTPYIYAILKKQLIKLQEEDMEEVISDVFLAVWKNQAKLDINKSMIAYIGGITKNLLRKRLKSYKQDSNIEDYEEILVSSSNIDIEYEEYERNQMIMKKLDSMKQEDKNIFILYYYHSNKIKEISLKLNISQSKVKSRLHTIRKKYFKIKEAKSNDE